ncbi:hypothetical protein JCM19297_2343 [Nonlabens ulvanivorans]|nr:hypothetical protein JCM19297_2343 [Nonlabens ulvanivorans]
MSPPFLFYIISKRAYLYSAFAKAELKQIIATLQKLVSHKVNAFSTHTT